MTTSKFEIGTVYVDDEYGDVMLKVGERFPKANDMLMLLVKGRRSTSVGEIVRIDDRSETAKWLRPLFEEATR